MSKVRVYPTQEMIDAYYGAATGEIIRRGLPGHVARRPDFDLVCQAGLQAVFKLLYEGAYAPDRRTSKPTINGSGQVWRNGGYFKPSRKGDGAYAPERRKVNPVEFMETTDGKKYFLPNLVAVTPFWLRCRRKSDLEGHKAFHQRGFNAGGDVAGNMLTPCTRTGPKDRRWPGTNYYAFGLRIGKGGKLRSEKHRRSGDGK